MGFRDDHLSKLPGDPRRNGRVIWEVTQRVNFSAITDDGGIAGFVPVGFQSDLVSAPGFPLFVLALPLGLHKQDMDRPSLVHDWLCQNYKYSKRLADSVFGDLMKQDGISAFRRFWIMTYIRQRGMRVQWHQPKLQPIVDANGATVGWEDKV